MAFRRYIDDRTSLGSTALAYLAGRGRRAARSYVKPTRVLTGEDGTTTWGGNATNVTKSADTTNVLTAASAQQSLKVTSTGAATTGWVTTAAFSAVSDLTDGFVAVRFYVHAGSGDSDARTNLTRIQLELFDSTDTQRGKFSIWENGSTYSHVGWNYWHAAVARASTLTNINDIKRVRVYLVMPSTGKTPAVSIDAIEFYGPQSAKKYLFTFDDGLDEHLECARYLRAKGMVGTFYVYPNAIGQTGFLTLAQLREIQRMGHLVANHTYTHAYLTSQATPFTPDEAAAVAEVTRCAEWLADNGFGAGARMLCPPYGRWHPDYDHQILGRHVDAIRLVGDGGGTDHSVHALLEPHKLHISAEDNATNAATVLTQLQSYGGYCCTLWHTLTGADMTNWKTHVDAVKTLYDAGTIDVVTPADLL